jgi:hypothetical protein
MILQQLYQEEDCCDGNKVPHAALDALAVQCFLRREVACLYLLVLSRVLMYSCHVVS